MLELRPSRTAAENKTADRRRKKGKILYLKFLYLILDYSHNHYTFKHFGV